MHLSLSKTERRYGIDNSHRMPFLHYFGRIAGYPIQGIAGIFGARNYNWDHGFDRVFYWAQIIGQLLSTVLFMSFLVIGLLVIKA